MQNTLVSLASPAQRQPPAPFISSSLQQAASNALKWDPDYTMKVAQRLYEQGVITYHRTDNPNVPDEAMDDIRRVAEALRLNAVDERRTSKAGEGAQEGHPAITPTNWSDEVAGENEEERALYKLILIRALASQLESAIYDVRTVKLLAVGPDRKPLRFVATGRTVTYLGWMKLLQADDTDDGDETSPDNPVPALSPKQLLQVFKGEVLHQKTKPPARFTKASLIKEMERRGIGRPSTFASILKNITTKGLIEEKNRKLVPASLGEESIAELEGNYSFVELDFTRELEQQLDQIAQGKDTYLGVVTRLHERLEQELSSQRARPGMSMQNSHRTVSASEFKCPKCGETLVRRVKPGKGGYDFWGCRGYKTQSCKISLPTRNGKPDFNKPRG